MATQKKQIKKEKGLYDSVKQLRELHDQKKLEPIEQQRVDLLYKGIARHDDAIDQLISEVGPQVDRLFTEAKWRGWYKQITPEKRKERVIIFFREHKVEFPGILREEILSDNNLYKITPSKEKVVFREKLLSRVIAFYMGEKIPARILRKKIQDLL